MAGPRMPDTPTRRFTTRYIVALVITALFTLGGVALIERSMSRLASDAHAVNIAGRQRMLSQRLAKEALALQAARTHEEATRWRGALRQTLAAFEAGHRDLLYVDPEGGVSGELSPELQTRLAALAPDMLALVGATNELIARSEPLPTPGAPAPVAALLNREAPFLAEMEEIVDLLDAQASRHVQALSRLAWAVAAAILLTQLCLGALVFRPAVRRMTQEMVRQHRLQRQLLDAVTAEQHRIGSDLHDGLLQQLTGMSLLTRSLLTRAERGAPVETEHVAQIGTLLDQAIAEARRISRAMMPVVLEQKGLAYALEDLVRNAGLTARVRCTSHIELNGRLPEPSKSNHLYRIAQEALANALKHSQAENVALELVDVGDALELRVRDDGVGLVTPDSAQRLGMGLRTMEYRARAIGAVLRVELAAPKGTVVRCRLPDARFSTGGVEPQSP